MAKRMTDEERYGKVGAEIRRLDPEAYKNRPKTMEGNLKLLQELRARGEKTPARQMSVDEFMRGVETRQLGPTSSASGSLRGPQNPRRYPGQGAAQRQASRATAAMERNRSLLPSDRATSFRSQAEETGLNEAERAEKAREYAKNVAMTAGAARLGALAGGPYSRTAGQFRRAADKASEMRGKVLARKDVPSYSERYAAGESAAARRASSPRRAREEAERMLDEKLAADMGGGFKRGGKVKKYSGGGSISSASKRADGIASKGKTKGRII